MQQVIEVKVGEKVFNVREFLASEVDAIDFSDSKKAIGVQVKLATGMSDSDYAMLTFKERLVLQKEINKLNGIGEEPNNF